MPISLTLSSFDNCNRFKASEAPPQINETWVAPINLVKVMNTLYPWHPGKASMPCRRKPQYIKSADRRPPPHCFCPHGASLRGQRRAPVRSELLTSSAQQAISLAIAANIPVSRDAALKLIEIS